MLLAKIFFILFSIIFYGGMLTYEPRTKIGWILYVTLVPCMAIALFYTLLLVMTI